ncbi:hypothetical protein GLOTRDRAFT_95206 [Gloeophyllum trabeum ATCC 11539]|uniref:Uncharacterized protein n=1 Tax=Gloeophyllum trabeum (strain ATCC 11539 / FP-39264 / Madison 617) TaxID=670483 RepID=S7RG44_GLOTA|nr:uncharacterized protein GLOTRDRAFT_95206 [Gloeophyllum trabeum ATCC 11539]EPQ53200.1 hypothetical protein GLOTRDRAFT_95206 [Gloeophyllum trabeum ATCC 11539]
MALQYGARLVLQDGAPDAMTGDKASQSQFSLEPCQGACWVFGYNGLMRAKYLGASLSLQSYTHVLMMDNASNCITTSNELAKLEMFISFFFKQHKCCKGNSVIHLAHEEELNEEDQDLATLHKGELLAGASPDQEAHDEQVVISAESQSTLKDFPNVMGLSKKVHDSPTLKEAFDKLVEADITLKTDCLMLARCCLTYWNTEHKSTSYKLKSLVLTEDQSALIPDLLDVLEIFNAPTKLFSEKAGKQMPLIIYIIPMFEDMMQQLQSVHQEHEIAAVLWVAAHASLKVVQKYYSLSSDCRPSVSH